MFFKVKNEQKEAVVDVQWGGYYATRGESGYTVFRLLDFNQDIMHIQMFEKTFDKVPEFDQVKDLQPSIWHVPMDAGAILVWDEVTLIGHKELDAESLKGYEEYGRQMGDDEPFIKELAEKVIGFSHEDVLRLRLVQAENGVTATRAD